MSPDKKKHDGPHLVPVSIYGQTYSLRADDDPAYVEKLAEYVDGRIREVADRTRTADTGKLFILAALNIADDLHRLKKEGRRSPRSVDARAQRMESLLDQALS
jgi:cell division protein ZapA